MSKSFKFLIVLGCFLVFFAIQFQIALAANPVVYEVKFSGEHKVRSTTVPAAIKGYIIHVNYEVWASDSIGFWDKENPYFHVTNSVEPVSFHLYGTTKTGSFDVPKDQSATVSMDSGSAWNLPTNHWGFSCSYKLTYYYDSAPPQTPERPFVKDTGDSGVYSPDQLTSYTRYNPVPLCWTTPNDIATVVDDYTYGPAGIKDYLIYNGSNAITDWVTGNQANLTLTDGTTYNIGLCARDNDGNISGIRLTRTIIADRTAPSGSLTIQKTDGNNLYTNPQTNLSYTNSTLVKLSVTGINDGANGSGISQIRFSNQDSEAYYTSWAPCSASSYTQNNWNLTDPNRGGIPGDGVKTVYVQLKDNVGNITTLNKNVTLETIAPTGSISIGSGSGTTVITKNSVKYINGVSITLALSASDYGSGLSSLMQLSTTNYNPETYVTSKAETLPSGDGQKTVSVKYFDNAGNSITRSDSITLDQTAPTGSISINNGAVPTSNTSVTLNLAANDGLGIGVSQMRIWDTTTDTGWIAYQTTMNWTLDGTGADGPRTVSVQYKDQLGNYDNSKIYQGAITLDRTAPRGAFAITSQTGQTLDNTLHPTNITAVRITNITVNDDLGPLGSNSGVKGVYFWNGTGNTPPGDARYIEIAALPPSTGYLDWTLTSGVDGDRTVTLQVVDNAGNSYLYRYTVALDTTPPGVAANFSHSYANGQLTIAWQGTAPNSDLDHFTGSYTLPGGTPTTFTAQPSGTNKEGWCTIDISDILEKAPNQLVVITVSSVDNAGNQSDSKIGKAYTPAQLGTLNLFPENETGPHELKWQLFPGVADFYKLEYREVGSEDFTAIDPDFDGIFVLTNLTPHGMYHYRLVAYNGDEDPTYGEVNSQQVYNQAPEKPSLISPLDYVRNVDEFNYECEEFDRDGDKVTPRIYLSTSPELDSFSELPNNTPSGLIPGKTYYWYVRAGDSFTEFTDSDIGNFTLDTTEPTLSADKLTYPTNQTSLTLTAGDTLSGIDRITYQKLNPITKEILDERVIVPAPGARTVTETIPLTEGSYHLYFTAWDEAGNFTQLNFENLRVDHTDPILSNLKLELPESQNGYFTSKLMFPVSFTATDDFSGIGVLRYWLLEDRYGNLNNGQLIQLSPTPDPSELRRYNLEISGVSGQEYYLALRLEDQAGNQSEVTYLGPILVDLTPPQASLALEGIHRSSSGLYTSSLSELTVNPVATDPETGISEVILSLMDTTTGTLTPWGDWNTLKGASLSPGHVYRIVVMATNNVGLFTQSQSEAFTFDNTLPQVSVTGPTGRLASGEMICFDLAATDPETPITGYRLGIVDYNNSEQTLPIAGSEPGGWLFINSSRSSTQVRIELPIGADGVYYPVVVAYNAAGLVGTRTGNAFTLDNTQEKVLVSDQGPYTMFTDHLSGWWLSVGTKPVDHYRYRIVSMDNQVVCDWENTTGNSVTVTGLSLTQNAGYRFEVQDQYSDGTYSESGFSPGITVDITQPELTRLSTPEYCTSANLIVQWAGQDQESGIQSVQAALGSDFNQTDVTGGWVTLSGTTAYLSRDAVGQPLQLITREKYYLTLRLTNGAGIIIEQGSAAITIDDTPPPTPVVLDQGVYLNTQQPLEANWLFSPVDPESGPDTYQWALLEYGEDPETAVWRDVGSSMQIKFTDCPQQNGKTYFFAVRATNRAGLSSIGFSNGITIDATAPYLPEVKLLNAVNLGNPEAAEEVNYITDNQNLRLWINSWDDISPIVKYFYGFSKLGTVDELTPEGPETGGVIYLDDPSIEVGVLTIFAGECLNQAGLLSGIGYSTGVILDTSAPKIIEVHAGVSGNQLYFDWNVEISFSPVAKYEVALVKLGDSAPAVWTDNGLERTYTYDGQNLADGKYYLLIRATNQAGTQSPQEGESPIVTLDRTAPVISEFTCGRYASNQLNMQLTATDNLSGIGGYQYALGSKTNPLQYSGGWVDIDSQAGILSYPIPTAGIPQLKEVYLIVRAKDRAGLWSAAQISQAITIDHTAPVKPVVTSGRYTTSLQGIYGIQFTSEDPDSGITHYRLGVVTKLDGEPLAVPLRPIDEFNGQITGLALTEAGVYYLAVQTQNAAGDWSEVGYSDSVTADTIAPQLVFSQAGSTIVINKAPVGIEYTLSEAAQVKFTQTEADGTAKEVTDSGQAGENQFIFTEGQPQLYQLTARAVDTAGNTGEIMNQTIRVNAPPRITIASEFNSTPGARVQFQAAVVDPDGTGAGLTYLWDPGDGSNGLTGEAPEHQYLGEPRDYLVTLTVTDGDGGTTTATTVVKVQNTSQGRLYMDETWQGIHRISGQLVVPAGVTLTIEPGAKVIIDGILDEEESYLGLMIEGSLNVGTGVIFRSDSGTAGAWRGIIVTGQASLTGVTIRDAERGLAVLAPGQAMVIDCSFIGNIAGVHVYGAKPVIRNCLFQDNLWYGIKEDEGEGPVVIGCRFVGNGIDYYQDMKTKITVDELNGIEGNSGNSSEF